MCYNYTLIYIFNKMKKLFFVLFAIVYVQMAMAQQAPQLGKASVKEVIKAMTLDEKARFVRGNGMNIPGLTTSNENGTLGMTKDKVPGAAGTTYAIPRLGIPSTVLSDGPAGLRIDPTREGTDAKFYATAWPIASLQAASWNPGLTQQIARAYGEEAKAYGVDVVLGPGMNIQKNTLNGRNFEYYSEDPYLSGKMAAAFTRGVQTNDGVGVSIKHFVANNQETNRNTINNLMSERALREIYLRGFEIVVKEADPFTVMSSYNKINGTYTSQSADLLTDILRKDWGFKGYVMTDWLGGDDPVAQMKAGNDLLMPGSPDQTEKIIAAVKNGTLEEALLDRNIEKILNIIEKSVAIKGEAPSNDPDLTAHALLARNSATEGMVLLKNNESALPIASWETVSLFGITSYELVAGGTGSGNVFKPYTSSLEAGLLNHFILVDEGVSAATKSYIVDERAKQPKQTGFLAMILGQPRLPEMPISKEMADEAAKTSNVAVFTIGRNSGEFYDRPLEGDFKLSEVELANIATLSEAFRAVGKKLVVLINAGGTIEVASWRDKADAILMAWQAGLEGGNAIADVISGAVNPSGKTPMTFPLTYEDMASSKSFPGTEDKSKVVREFFGTKIYNAEIAYDDDIYVGYRYFDTFNVKPAYEFGFGLSYTTFELSDLELSSAKFDGSIDVSVKVTNTGAVAGKEVAQVYVSAPKSSFNKPVQELRAFAKTDVLAPGASQTLKFTLSGRDLASYNNRSNAWVADRGTYTVKVGNSSRNIQLAKTFSLAKTTVVEKTTKSLTPLKKFKVLK